ncbi:MAG: hypothetical protein RLO80_01600 [Hyphomonas sp.]
MKPSPWRGPVLGLALCLMPLAAGAQGVDCAAGAGPDALLQCDLQRAELIRARAETYYGEPQTSLVEITDTASPSGSAYVYDVLTDGDALHLKAGSVPDGRGPRCRLETTLPMDTAAELRALLEQTADEALPGYGPREEVTLNPDGSRHVRMVFDSHDIITRADTPDGLRQFSRHAGSDDPVNRLNNLVIGFANLSSAWNCKTS